VGKATAYLRGPGPCILADPPVYASSSTLVVAFRRVSSTLPNASSETFSSKAGETETPATTSEEATKESTAC